MARHKSPGKGSSCEPEHLELILYRLQRARETLQEAALLRQQGYFNACVNRLYYACFYAVSALLLTAGHSSSKHRGIRSLFDRHWVSPERVPRELGKTYRKLFLNRQKGDDADLLKFSREEAEYWTAPAEAFVAQIAPLVQKHLKDKR